MTKHLCLYTLCAIGALLATSCSSDQPIDPKEDVQVSPQAQPSSTVDGFYLLNEGNMGMNASSLDYYDYASGTYSRNIFASANPDVPKELGDVGNDLQIHGSRLYAVINCSNKVEVMDSRTARRIGQVDIPNCRYIAFDRGYAYVTSYAGPVQIDPEYTQRGYVAKIDTATLQTVATCNVGFQPDGLAIADGKIYVANSGGYMTPNYENTISVIDLQSFTITSKIEIAINLQHILVDSHGALWVSSRGDYFGTPAQLYRYDLADRRITNTYDLCAGTMWLDGDLLYVVGSSFNYDTGDETPTYATIDTDTRNIKKPCFVSLEVKQAIVKPYGVAVNPENHQILVTDAGNYVNPGQLHCLGQDGNELWNVRTGDIPAHFAFLKN